MMTATRVPCLCGCSQTFAPRRSLPLCKEGGTRAFEVFTAQTQGMTPDEYQRANFAFYSNPDAIRAALATVTVS